MQSTLSLINLILSALEDREATWVEGKIEKIKSEPTSKNFYLAFGMVPRVVKRSIVSMGDDQLIAMRLKADNYDPQHWRHDELARLALMLSLPGSTSFKIIDPMFATADMSELVALYKGLYFLEDRERYVDRAIDGIRTNMSPVFDAIALHSKMPYDYFNESAWNQMVLKAIFMGRPIYRIYGLDERRNQALAQIAQDFAHERWAAGRKVTPELWRLTVPYVDETIFEDLKKAFLKGDSLEKSAAGRAMLECTFDTAKPWLQKSADFESKSWDEIGQEFEALTE